MTFTANRHGPRLSRVVEAPRAEKPLKQKASATRQKKGNENLDETILGAGAEDARIGVGDGDGVHDTPEQPKRGSHPMPRLRMAQCLDTMHHLLCVIQLDLAFVLMSPSSLTGNNCPTS